MMRCDQQEKCYLYHFGELKGSDKRAFKKHLKECEFCQLELNRLKHVWKELNDLPVEQPSSEVAEKIRQRAEQHQDKRNIFDMIAGWLSMSWLEYKKPLSFAAAILVVVLLVFVSPLQKIIIPNLKNNMFTEWNDSFITQVNQIDSSLDRMESSDLLSDLRSLNEDEKIFEEDDWTSPFMEEINTIRESLKYINTI